MIRYSPIFQVPIPDGRFGRFLHTLLGSEVVVCLLMSRRQKTTYHRSKKMILKSHRGFIQGVPPMIPCDGKVSCIFWGIWVSNLIIYILKRRHGFKFSKHPVAVQFCLMDCIQLPTYHCTFFGRQMNCRRWSPLLVSSWVIRLAMWFVMRLMSHTVSLLPKLESPWIPW